MSNFSLLGCLELKLHILTIFKVQILIIFLGGGVSWATFSQKSFSLVEIGLHVEFQPYRMLRTQSTLLAMAIQVVVGSTQYMEHSRSGAEQELGETGSSRAEGSQDSETKLGRVEIPSEEEEIQLAAQKIRAQLEEQLDKSSSLNSENGEQN